jgi:hypothetical protein
MQTTKFRSDLAQLERDQFVADEIRAGDRHRHLPLESKLGA